MHSVRRLMFVFSASAVILACSFAGAAATPETDNIATVVASTIQALTPAAAPSETQPPAAASGVPVTYKNVTFTIPTGLATNAVPQTVPASTEDNGGPWGVAPEHLEFTFDGYRVGPNSFRVNQIDVYPADVYGSANTGANIGLQRLRALLAAPSAPLTNETLPQVPSFNAASMFVAQVKRLDFQNGRGVRTITQYGQAFGPAANNATFYHFQGLTNDGKYYIIAVLPIQAPFLQNGDGPNAPLPPGGVPFPGYNAANPSFYTDYFTDVATRLDATPDDQFSPPLGQLDALLRSLSVSP